MTTTKPTMVFAFDGKRVARVEETRPEEELCRFGKKGGVFSPGKKSFGGEDCDYERTTTAGAAPGGRNGRRRINVKREMKRFMASETKRIVGKDDDDDDENATTTKEKKKNTSTNNNTKNAAADSKSRSAAATVTPIPAALALGVLRRLRERRLVCQRGVVVARVRRPGHTYRRRRALLGHARGAAWNVRRVLLSQRSSLACCSSSCSLSARMSASTGFKTRISAGTES